MIELLEGIAESSMLEAEEADQVNKAAFALECVRAQLINQEDQWRREVSGADLIQDITLILEQAGLGATNGVEDD